MYAIRVQVEEGRLAVRASGQVGPEEALRAVSQAFALAEAGSITRATCDLSAVEGGSSGIVVLGAAFASRVQPSQQVAIVISSWRTPCVCHTHASWSWSNSPSES